jgi:uncharacterized membrane protein YkvI
MTIVGTTIGAGFASGREIWEFFGSYGEASQFSILLSMFVFFIASIILLTISWKKQTKHYSEVLEQIIGPGLARLFDWIVLFYLLSTTVVMIAGSGATFEQWSGNHSYILGCVIMVGAVFFILLFDVKGLMSINTLLMPLLTFILVMVSVQFLQVNQTDYDMVRMKSDLPVWPSAIAYAAFNIISLLAVLSTMGSQIERQSEIWLAGLISMVSLGGVATLYNYSLLKIEHLISQYEIPLFALVQDYSPVWLFLISCVLWFAIYTTTISNVHGLVFRLSAILPWPRWIIGLFSLLILAPMSQFGFSRLVQVLYPLYGVINLLILAAILMYPFSQTTRSVDRNRL